MTYKNEDIVKNIVEALNEHELNDTYFRLSYSEIVYQNLDFEHFLYFNINKEDGEVTFENRMNKAKCSYKFPFDEKDPKMIKFINCSFLDHPIIGDTDIQVCNFVNCNFDYSIKMDAGILEQDNRTKEKKFTRNDVYFRDCKFFRLEVGSIAILNKPVNQRINILGGCIKELIIQNVEVKSKFYINKQYGENEKQTTIEEFRIKNTIFKENFKLHNCQVNKSIIEDVDFEEHADFFKSIFKKGINVDCPEDKSINFRGLNFKGLALFGDCEFQELLKFQYVTFENFSHFRRAKFLKGLDLDYTNIQKEMNFFDIEGLDSNQSKSNTSQETYRIIKHNFSKIGNTIEANKYHALELGRHSKNVWKKGKILDGVVSFLFLITSNFSQNWLLPLFWIFVVGVITASNIIEVSLWKVPFSYIAKYSTIFTYNDLKEYPVLFLFNKISLGFLYYQFILSVRKNTRK